MRWYHSLNFKITIIFFTALVGLGAMGGFFIGYEKAEEARKVERYSRFTLRTAFHRPSGEFDQDVLTQEGFVLITDPKLITRLIEAMERKTKLSPLPNFEGPRHMGQRFFRTKIIHYHGDLYALTFFQNNKTIVFKTPIETETKGEIFLVFSLIVLLFILYILTLRSIRPLKPLKENIEALAKGNFDIRCNSKGKDEIAAVAHAFDTTVQKIKDLRDARQLFLRNIMHELKTPITKGKLSTEMIEDSPYKEKLINAFRRQEHLLEEFSRIEKLGAGEITLHKASYSLEDVMAQVLDLLDDKTDHIHMELQPIQLNVDFDLFSVALKNIIDNGINYSSDHQVHVKMDDTHLCICNQGMPLEHPLEKYKEPYFLEGKKQKESRGLGFGLFIALHIFELHEFTCTYTHEKGQSIFCIEF